ncbi:murein DD-endopeptidase MepM/ murein hydrolase activator NlpD [Trueperella bonasi]|uniref:Murein DD-endopeptidase MepM/ murein hydrolase activator NlpD n=1 Tax=Trueperella bonasi TaxID=312286 RepID=A0ABT9NIB0_9ACTO|nr:M23 family metallopeptidase [Trueperella bonasi]MDP9806940.1 murein DD-endopeptidase MepM/ murein hydrolase activator NlpD [Trueperella bonasi]
MKKQGFVFALLALGGAGLVALPAHTSSELPLAPWQDVSINIDSDRAASVEYSWPSGTEVPVLRPFAMGPANWNAGHRGVDLALAKEQPVYAAAEGTVIYAGMLNDRELVSIKHADGIRTTYEPITPAVGRGERVDAGQIIGHVDGAHCFPSACLHWGAKRGQDGYLDPLSLLTKVPIRLYE